MLTLQQKQHCRYPVLEWQMLTEHRCKCSDSGGVAPLKSRPTAIPRIEEIEVELCPAPKGS